jgi:3-oxoacyl-[acyl-carrier protein] reductase
MGLLDGQVALVTGSTRGIGHAMATRFAAEGARVVVHGRRADVAQEVASHLPGAVGIGADITDLDAVRSLVGRVVDELGGVDVLVNNAGISVRSAITRLTDDDWERVIDANLTAPMRITREVVPHMKAQGGGVIVNVISGAGTAGTVGFSAYGASKGGLHALTLTLAQELAPFGIRVNSLSPSALTDMMRELPEEILAEMAERLPPAADVAGAALFLASDLSATVSGQVVHAIGRYPRTRPRPARP